MMIVSPKYVRSLELQNKVKDSFDLKVVYQSGQIEVFNFITPTLNIQRTISHGSYNTVDPIVMFQVIFSTNIITVNTLDAKSVQKRKYRIQSEKEVIRIYQ